MASGNGFGFESGSNGDDLTAGNSGGDFIVATGGTAKISTAHKAHGTRSALFTGTTASGALYLSKSIASTDDIAARVYVYWDTLPTSTVRSLLIFLNGSSQLANLEVNAAGNLGIRDDSNANIWTSDAAMTTGQWYRIEFAIHRDPTSGTARAAIYLGDGTDPVTDGDSGVLTGQNTGSASVTRLRVGAETSTSTDTMVVYMDDWDYDPATSDLIGPYTVVLATPDVTLGTTTNVSSIGADDGKQEVTWDAITGATSYEAWIADGDTPTQEDFTQVETDVTSPYTFTGLTPGVHSYGIKAKG